MVVWLREIAAGKRGGPLNFVPPDWLLYAVRDDTRKTISEKYDISGEFADSLVAWRGHMRRRDQLWYFNFPKEAWSTLAGREGFAVVRKGRQIAVQLIRMS